MNTIKQALLIGALLISCSRGYMILEREFIGEYTLVDDSSKTGVVTISGYSQHSSLKVHDCRVTESGKTKTVMVYLVPYKTSMQGNFKIEVPVGTQTDRIVFGKKQAVVWQRKQ